MSLNVNREVSDDFYRYKMPRIIAKVEGKGNGIKTVIVNMPEVGKALCRPPIYPTKYFGAELGAQIQFDQKNERYIVNGSHEGDKLQSILDGFIKKYVLCTQCENPETDFIVKSRGKQGELHAKCKACGAITTINDNSRTTQFIIKNPPDETGLNLASSGTVGGKGKGRRKRTGADRSPEAGNSDENDNGDGDEKGAAAEDGEDDDNGFDSDDWDGDEQAPVEELPDSIKRLIVTDELELTPQDRANRFLSFLNEKMEAGFDKDTPQQLVMEAERLDIREKAVVVVAEVLLTSPATIVTDITKKYRVVFLTFTKNNIKSQKYLIGAVESLIQRFEDVLLDQKRIPNLLNAFYNADILTEEVLLEWDNKGPSKRHTGDRKLSKTIHEFSKPFINWLQTADEESSDDNKESENEKQPVAVANGKTASSGQSDQGAAQSAANKEEEDDDSDVDIDNI